jgi:hypothetical protein
MVKKMFALASVTALTGLMVSVAAAGCSSTTEVNGTDTTDAATNPDTGKKAPADGGGTGDEEEPPVSTECKGLTEVDTSTFPWKAPYKEVGACAKADLDGLVDFLGKNNTAPYTDWKKSVTDAECSACIFGKDTDTTWKPLFENAQGQLVGLNVGGCISIVSNNDKCGQAYQNWFDCPFEACADCPADDDAAFTKCRTAANSAKGGCKKALDAVLTVCGDTTIDAAETACKGSKFVFEGPIKAQCIGLTADGGDQ